MRKQSRRKVCEVVVVKVDGWMSEGKGDDGCGSVDDI